MRKSLGAREMLTLEQSGTRGYWSVGQNQLGHSDSSRCKTNKRMRRSLVSVSEGKGERSSSSSRCRIVAHLLLLSYLFVEFACRTCSCTAKPNYLETGKQITGILDRFMSLGYDKRVRPNYGGPPVEVNVTMRILSISSVSEVMMDFTADFYFRQTWQDPRLSFKKLGDIQTLYVGAEVSKKIWLPDTFFGNEKLAYFHEATTPNVFLRIDHSGEVYRSIRLTVTSSCPMNLQYFPMDRQRCTIEAESYGYNVKDIIYKWAREDTAVERDKEISLPQFDIVKTVQKYRLEELSSGTYSRLIAEIHFARRMGYYLIQIYIPSSLIVVISWVSFWLHRNASPARVQLGVTTVLTMTTLMSSTNAALPKISYVKSIDIFLGTCFIMVFAALLEYATVGYLGKRIAMRKAQMQHAQSQAQARLFAQLQAQGAQGDLVPPTASQLAEQLVQEQQQQQHQQQQQQHLATLSGSPISPDLLLGSFEPIEATMMAVATAAAARAPTPVPPERHSTCPSHLHHLHQHQHQRHWRGCRVRSHQEPECGGCGAAHLRRCTSCSCQPTAGLTGGACNRRICSTSGCQTLPTRNISFANGYYPEAADELDASKFSLANDGTNQNLFVSLADANHLANLPPAYGSSAGRKGPSAAATAAAATFVNLHRRQKGLPPSNNPNFAQFTWMGQREGSGKLETIFGVRPSDIDKYSRVVFPVCFVCFQLMYWIVYLHISAFLEGAELPSNGQQQPPQLPTAIIQPQLQTQATPTTSTTFQPFQAQLYSSASPVLS